MTFCKIWAVYKWIRFGVQDCFRGRMQDPERTPSQQKNRDWTAGQSPEKLQFTNGRKTGAEQNNDLLYFKVFKFSAHKMFEFV